LSYYRLRGWIWGEEVGRSLKTGDGSRK